MAPDSEPPSPAAAGPATAWLAATGDDPFAHPAVLYHDTSDYLAHTIPFLLDGLAEGEPAAVAVPGPNLTAIREELSSRGGQPEQVTWLDMTEAGRNPGRIIPFVLRAFADRHSTHRVRIIGEPVWAERSRIEYPACAQHEALINSAFSGRRAAIMCPYDVERLTGRALADAAANHPLMVRGTRWWASPDYAPGRVVETYNQPLHLPGAVRTMTVTHTRCVRSATGSPRPPPGPASPATGPSTSCSPRTTNAVEHGAGGVRFSTWTTHRTLVVQVDNQGRLTNPLAGRIPASPTRERGRGLLSVNAIADLVRIHTTEDHTSIRAYFDLPLDDHH